MTTSQLQIIVLIGVMLFAVIATLSYSLKSRRLLQKYWLRPCTGKVWKRRFPEVPKQEIRDFLEAFVDGFGLSSKKRLKFNPDDKVTDIYRALYPTPGWPDALELEGFARNLERKYGFDLAKVTDQDITLGKIFEMARKKSQQMHQPDAE